MLCLKRKPLMRPILHLKVTDKRKPEETVSDYIIEFEHRYSKAKKFEMALPDSVLAY